MFLVCGMLWTPLSHGRLMLCWRNRRAWAFPVTDGGGPRSLSVTMPVPDDEEVVR